MNSSRFIINDCFNRNSNIFSHEEIFEPSYIPDHLLHHEEELSTLAQYFKPLISKKGKNHGNHVIIQGSVGLGKTALAKQFGTTLESYCYEKKELNLPKILYFHLNCRRLRSWNILFTTILRQLVPAFPVRGYSAPELLEYLESIIHERKQKLLLCLDEVDYLLMKRKNGDIFYSLIRNYERTNSRNLTSISLILITRNPHFQLYLDSALYSSLSKRMITFNPYTDQQLFNILHSRAKLGLKNTSYSYEVLKEIASLAQKYGDARYALELLWRSAKVAESEGKQEIMFEDIRKAQISHFPIKQSTITDLHLHLKLLLLSIANLLLQFPDKSNVFTSDVKSEYEKICLEKGQIPRKQTQFWVYLQELKQSGVIQLEVVNRHKKGKSGGRSAKVSITDLPVHELIEILNESIIVRQI